MKEVIVIPVLVVQIAEQEVMVQGPVMRKLSVQVFAYSVVHGGSDEIHSWEPSAAGVASFRQQIECPLGAVRQADSGRVPGHVGRHEPTAGWGVVAA